MVGEVSLLQILYCAHFWVGKNENNSEIISRKKSKTVYGTESLF